MTIPIVRAAHLNLYIGVLREVGVPVDRSLARSRLPAWVEETPDAYVSLPLALEWAARSGRDADAAELGYRAALRMSPATLDAAVRTAVLAAPTVRGRIEALSRLAHREDSALSVEVRPEGRGVRIVCHMPDYSGVPYFVVAEWLNIQALTSLVRTAAAPGWCPTEITFVSRSRQCDAALEAYGNARILYGQRRSSILVGADVLARSAVAAPPPDVTLADLAAGWDFLAALRLVLRPYLQGGVPELALAAEIAGMSARTFQRRLAACGRSYSQVVQEARFEVARDLLSASDGRIIDVAMAAGYENPQHFSRAFRRISGVSPKVYRRMAM